MITNTPISEFTAMRVGEFFNWWAVICDTYNEMHEVKDDK